MLNNKESHTQNLCVAFLDRAPSRGCSSSGVPDYWQALPSTKKKQIHKDKEHSRYRVIRCAEVYVLIRKQYLFNPALSENDILPSHNTSCFKSYHAFLVSMVLILHLFYPLPSHFSISSFFLFFTFLPLDSRICISRTKHFQRQNRPKYHTE